MAYNIPNELFHNKSEQAVAVLGQGYLGSILSGSGFGNSSLILTDKRVYQFGQVYSKEGGKVTKTRGRQVVDIENVTGVSIISIKNQLFLWLGIALMVIGLAILGITAGDDPVLSPIGGIIDCGGFVLLIVYFVSIKKYVSLNYAGGSILSLCSQFSQQDIFNFQKMVSQVKEQFKQKQQSAAAPLQQPKDDVYTSIEKLSQLKDKGIITEEEFINKKTQLLGL